MFYCSVQEMQKLGIIMHAESEAGDIDYTKKTLNVKCLKTQKIQQIQYDTLVISSGSTPIVPKFAADLGSYKNLFLCKNYEHGKQIFNYVKQQSKKGQKIAVIGGGYIGIELCECFCEHGFAVTCVEGEDRIMKRYFDAEFTEKAENLLQHHNCQLALKKLVEGITQKGDQLELLLNDKSTLTVDACVLCIGFRPNTDFAIKAAEAQNVTLKNTRGAINVSAHCETSVPGVYAIGDAAMCFWNPAGQEAYIPLATNAIRQAVAAASHICHSIDKKIPLIAQIGTQGTSALKLFETAFSSSGLSEECARQYYKDDVAACAVTDDLTPGFVDNQLGQLTTKLVYKKSTGELLGVQVQGLRAAEICQIASVLIQNKTTLVQLIEQDFSFNPWYNKPVHPLVAVAMKAVLG